MDEPAGQVAVVVDVLRATSVMVTALAHGAREIIACVEIEEARQIAANGGVQPLLCGERLCQPIVGFDLGNSPSDYTPSLVKERSLVMTTTNGTRALAAARNAKRVFAGAFVNLSAVAERLRSEDQVTIVCAGTDGEETEEDILFAGALIDRLGQWEIDVILDDGATDAADQWHSFLNAGGSLVDKLSRSRGGRNLVLAGYLKDIEDCAQVSSLSAVPVMATREPITLRL